MAFQKKYYFDFYRLNTTEKHTVEIWQDTAEVLTAVEITGMASPLVVEMPELDNKFQVVRGKGCSLTIVSETDGQFFDSLYHVDPTEIKLIHKISDVTANLFYLDSEMMQEPFSENKNYPVNITGNDGLGLMDRFSFVEVGGAPYEGIKSKLEILQIILNKIGLWTQVGFDLATTFTGSTSLLGDSFVNCSNFYDEDGKPMSLREVADSILAPYGAHMEAKGEYVLISDIHSKATKATINYSMFLLSTLAATTALNMANVQAITAASFRGTGSDKERSGGVNRQVVSYSPYPVRKILEKSLTGVEEFTSVPGAFSTKDGYYYKTLGGNEFWAIDFAHSVTVPATTFEASYYTSEKDATVYLRRPTYTNDGTTVASLISGPYLTVVSGVIGGSIITTYTGRERRRRKYFDGAAIIIEGEILNKTKANPYNDLDSEKNIIYTNIYAKAKIGSYYYNGGIDQWSASASTFSIATGAGAEFISDKWVKMSRKLSLSADVTDLVLNGELELELLTGFKSYFEGSTVEVENSPFVKEIWMRNITIRIVGPDGEELSDSDAEYIGLLDKNFQNEGAAINLTCGTDVQFADRGKIMKFVDPDYIALRAWTRAGQTYKVEELLLNSLCSNYKAGFVTLSNMKLVADFPLHTIFTDATVPDVKLMVKSAKIDYHENLAEVTLVEIQEDELTIVKE